MSGQIHAVSYLKNHSDKQLHVIAEYVEALERELSDLNKRYSTWHSDLDYKAADRRITLQCQVIEQLEEQVTELQAQLDQKSKELATLVQYEQQAAGRVVDLESQLAEANKSTAVVRLRELNVLFGRVDKENQWLKVRIAELEGALHKINVIGLNINEADGEGPHTLAEIAKKALAAKDGE